MRRTFYSNWTDFCSLRYRYGDSYGRADRPRSRKCNGFALLIRSHGRRYADCRNGAIRPLSALEQKM